MSKRINIFFTTDDTIRDMDRVESSIIRAAEMNGGIQTGGGLGPEGREVSLEFAVHSEMKPFLKQLRTCMSMLTVSIPSLKVTHEIPEQ